MFLFDVYTLLPLFVPLQTSLDYSTKTISLMACDNGKLYLNIWESHLMHISYDNDTSTAWLDHEED